MNSLDRLDYIDVAKGIGISLVVLGHTTISISSGMGKFVHDFIQLFHMPLFFLISGYLYNHKLDQSIWDYSKRKLYSLGVPFLIFWIIPSLYQIIFNDKSYRYLYEWIWVEQFDCWAIWFLYSLFIVSILYKILYLYIQKVSIYWIFIGGLLLFTIYRLHFYALLDTSAFCMIYYHIGYLCKVKRFTIKKSVVGIVCLFLLVLAKNFRDYSEFVCVNYRGFWFGNNDFVSTVVFALIGSLLVIWLSQYLTKFDISCKLFSYLGRNSIIIVCTHVQIMQSIHYICPNINWGGEFLLIIVSYFCGLIYVFNRYLPFVFGIRHRKGISLKNIHK